MENKHNFKGKNQKRPAEESDMNQSVVSLSPPADQPWRGGGSPLSAALHLQAGNERRRSQSGETLELLRLPGHQEHIRLGLSVHATGTSTGRTDGQAATRMSASGDAQTPQTRRYQGRNDFFQPTTQGQECHVSCSRSLCRRPRRI